jgi:hypothetical protein
MFSNRFPLWMPSGSVRAILALAVVFAAIAQLPPEAIEKLAMIVLPAYFVAKVATSK